MNHFLVKTLGCKVNQSESDALSAELKTQGLSDASSGTIDLCIINTCTVTEKASMQSRHAIRQAIRTYPNARIVVTGCYAQTQPEEIRKIKGVHAVISNTEKHQLSSAILSRVPEEALPLWHQASSSEPRAGRTRAFLKVQDGCNAGCTYCIVPRARGRSRSMPEDVVVSELVARHQSGFKEVVLSGIHLGCYGLDFLPKRSLAALLSRIEALEAAPRLRLSSIEPGELTDEIIDLVARSSRICRHFHIPLQSGDDHVLKEMGRRYSGAFFESLIRKVHARIPAAAIGLDVLVGFPGETEEAFENTYRLIKSLPVSYLHVFPFSPRSGTPAAAMPEKVPAPALKIRATRMRALGSEKKQAFYATLVGRQVEVLVEGTQEKDPSRLKGLTETYVPVVLPYESGMENRLVCARIERSLGDRGVAGSIISSPAGL